LRKTVPLFRIGQGRECIQYPPWERKSLALDHGGSLEVAAYVERLLRSVRYVRAALVETLGMAAFYLNPNRRVQSTMTMRTRGLRAR